MNEEQILVCLVSIAVLSVLLGVPVTIRVARLMRQERAERSRLLEEVAKCTQD